MIDNSWQQHLLGQVAKQVARHYDRQHKLNDIQVVMGHADDGPPCLSVEFESTIDHWHWKKVKVAETGQQINNWVLDRTEKIEAEVEVEAVAV